MATYKLIPSSWAGDATITDPSNAYADTTSTTYAGFKGTVSIFGYLGGFDFSVIPQGYIVKGLTVKIKAQGAGTGTNAALYSDVDGTPLSRGISISSDSAQVYTFSLTESVDTILGYSSTLCIRISCYSQNPASIYGAEVNVEAFKPRNKIIYGNETLIDLTSDTATASDVASGKTFHLASGLQATGTLVASPSVATATTTGSTARTVSFAVSKEPSWFMMICSYADATRGNRVQHMLYDGATTTTYYTMNTGYGTISSSTSYGSFSYSRGTLTISVTTAYIGAADWELYYL